MINIELYWQRVERQRKKVSRTSGVKELVGLLEELLDYIINEIDEVNEENCRIGEKLSQRETAFNPAGDEIKRIHFWGGCLSEMMELELLEIQLEKTSQWKWLLERSARRRVDPWKRDKEQRVGAVVRIAGVFYGAARGIHWWQRISTRKNSQAVRLTQSLFIISQVMNHFSDLCFFPSHNLSSIRVTKLVAVRNAWRVCHTSKGKFWSSTELNKTFTSNKSGLVALWVDTKILRHSHLFHITISVL